MNKKTLVLMVILVFCTIISLTTVNASIDSSSWSVENIGGVDFKIPPQYNGGNLSKNNDSYIYNNLNEFGILCVDTYLSNSYGYDACKHNCINITISNHEGVFTTFYNNYLKDNQSIFYFSVGDSIFKLSWRGNSITPEIEEIIANAPSSNLSLEEFHNLLDNGKNAYYEESSYDDYYEGDKYYDHDSYQESATNLFPIYYALYNF